jgi:preprotein translocase subunit SecY
MNPGGVSVVTMNPVAFRLLTIITMTAGTIFIMWLGEQISERGIGNGISLIIMIGILARYPGNFLNTWRAIKLGQITPFRMVFFLIIMVGVVAAVILITQGQRRIPVQYAKRIVGNKVYGGRSQYIPLRVNTAGVIPIIFAQSIMMFPSTIATFFGGGGGILSGIQTILAPGSWLYMALYALIIVFFTYFYTAIILNPTDMAENMKKYGGFIPGIRPGKRTSDYIDRILTRVTLPGAIFLAFIAILPDIMMRKGGLPFYFGGTGILIIVGVMLDTLQQIETHLLMRHYDGFMKKGRLRGRR